DWPRRGDLGLHLRNISQPPPGRGPKPGQFHPLDFCGPAHNFFPQDGLILSSWICVCILCRHDVPPVGVGENNGPRDQEHPPRAVTKGTGTWIDPTYMQNKSIGRGIAIFTSASKANVDEGLW